jgi:CARDB
VASVRLGTRKLLAVRAVMADMTRLSFAGAVLIVGCALVASAAAAALPRAQLTDYICQRALDPAARAISITAVMRPLLGTRKLSVRFALLTRSQSAPVATLVRAGDLGTWISPDDRLLGQQPGDVWKVNKPVVDLSAPATYRFRVNFRWIGAGERVLGNAVRYSPRCAQPELRPDLAVSSIDVEPIVARPNRDAYIAQIANLGANAAGLFEVLFAPADGSPAQTRTVRSVGAHRTVPVTFTGPLCTAGGAPTITADPDDQVDDLDRSNNVLTATCPAVAPTSAPG